MKTAWISIAVLCLATVAWALAEDAVSLVHTAKVNETVTYAVKTEVEIGGVKSVVTEKVVEKTTSVAADGSYAVESTYMDAKATVPGGAQTEIPQAPDTVVFKADGELSKLVGPKIDGTMVRIANMMVVKLPGKPVKVGDTWSHDVAADPKTGAAAAKADYRVTAREKIGAFDCLTVVVKYREPAVERPATCDETIWLEVGTGILVKRDAVMKNLPASFANPKSIVNATISVVRDQPAPQVRPPTGTS